MLEVNLNGCRPFIDELSLNLFLKKAEDAHRILMDGSGKGSNLRGWLTLPSATIASKITEQYKEVAQTWKEMGVNLVVTVGIGGSYLGARCAIEALSHHFAGRIGYGSFADMVFAGQNLSEEYIADLCELIEQKNTACIVISKSGNTIESAISFRIIKNKLEKKYGAEAVKRIIAVTDTNKGTLSQIARQEGYRMFHIEDNIGGRFSVLSPVGLLPLAVAEKDIDAMLQGAEFMQHYCENGNASENKALRYAALRNFLYAKGINIEILVAYTPKLRSFGDWWKQLFGESEGKDCMGIYPDTAIFTTDLHSWGQYVQQGRRIVMETTIAIQETKNRLKFSSWDKNTDNLNFLSGKNVEYCNHKAMLGAQLAHLEGGVPQIEVKIDKLDAYHLGAMFYLFEYVCAVSAYTLGVNPFDQPGVEEYKKNMFALLGRPGYEDKQKETIKKIKGVEM